MKQSADQKLVLIVDDTPTNVGVISGVLKDAFRTKVATNGEKALVLAAAADKPDLILLDVMMPGMDGFEVCRRLKADPATASLPVILLTARDDMEARVEGMNELVAEFLAKPVASRRISSSIDSPLSVNEAVIAPGNHGTRKRRVPASSDAGDGGKRNPGEPR